MRGLTEARLEHLIYVLSFYRNYSRRPTGCNARFVDSSSPCIHMSRRSGPIKAASTSRYTAGPVVPLLQHHFTIPLDKHSWQRSARRHSMLSRTPLLDRPIPASCSTPSFAFTKRVWKAVCVGMRPLISGVGRVGVGLAYSYSVGCPLTLRLVLSIHCYRHRTTDDTGQATVELTPFKRVFGIDPSAGMVDAARRALQAEAQDCPGVDAHPSASASGPGTDRITYVQSPAEKLEFLEDGSVDMIVSGTSCASPSP